MREPLLEVADLRYVYHPQTPQAVVALDGLSCVIGRGEYVGIVGGNGSGKSTLAKHFNALLVPTAGTVRVGGLDTRDRHATAAIRRRVGMVFQNPDNQLVATVVEEDVAFGPENLGLPPAEIRRRVDQALAAVGMTPYRRHAPHALSGGQKQRVAIAGVLAMRPECVVLDEPTTMLDPLGRADVLAVIRALHREHGITVVMISHALEDLADADRILVLEAGRLVQEGPPAEIFDRLAAQARAGLDPPPLAQLAAWLRLDGLPLPSGIHTEDRLVAALTALPRARSPRDA
ncbi:MAG: energy-coupling factor transporter ATPase [Armatimonadota bacterium]|nr:energy-coupling factor transporter ATPase [Armatimonadota bacterium]MDR7534063.1 energy-coupling factor transporter ATPase [Armatimonadota bacterium]MDR7537473.1 energy-coupling factor transporter ATPase [Armatimonadota bacterium]